MMGDIHPSEGEARRPRAPSVTEGSGLSIHDRVHDSAINNGLGQKGQRLMIQHGTDVHPVGRNQDGRQ